MLRNKPSRNHAANFWLNCSLIAILSVAEFSIYEPASAQDDIAVAFEAPVNHPLIVIATAGTDRLFERTQEVLQTTETAVQRSDVISFFGKMLAPIGPQSQPEQLDQLIDATKPFGVIVYWGQSAKAANEQAAKPAPAPVIRARPIQGNARVVVPPVENAPVPTPKPSPHSDIPGVDEDDDTPAPVKRASPIVEVEDDDENAAHVRPHHMPAVIHNEPDDVDMSNEESDGLHGLLDAFVSGDLGSNRIAYFAAIRDLEKFLAHSGLTPIDGEPKCYQRVSGEEYYLVRFGDYIVATDDEDLIEVCFDPRDMVVRLLGNYDAVISFQTKGLPPLLKGLEAGSIVANFESSLEQGDDESDRTYNLRRAFGGLFCEILDTAVTYIDEVNLGIRVEPKTLRFVFDCNIVGDPDGKLAKLASELSPKRASWGSVWNSARDFSTSLSLFLPERHARPIVSAIREYVATATDEEKNVFDILTPVIEVGCKILESGHLDLYSTGIVHEAKKGDWLIGLKVPADPAFPGKIQEFAENATRNLEETIGLEMTREGEVNGWPVHRINLRHVVFTLLNTTDGIVTISSTESEENGVKMTSNVTIDASSLPVHAWLAATPNELWIELSSNPPVSSLPELLTSSIKQQDAENARSATPEQTPCLLRVSANMREATFTSKVTVKVDGEIVPQTDPEEEKKEAETKKYPTFEQLIKSKSHGVLFELQPSAHGWKASLTFDEIYLNMLANPPLRESLGQTLGIILFLFF